MRRFFHLDLLAATAIFAAVIIYGSLYPFEFHAGRGAGGPIAVLLASWATLPTRGDFLANVLLYTPLGFFGLLATRAELGAKRRMALVLLTGGALSIAMECVQYFDANRITGARDVYSNVLGTGLGAAAALGLRPQLRWPFVARFAANPIPSILLAAWLGSQLFPYVPAIDLHKYWDALKPVIFYPRLTAFDLFRYTISWLAVCLLVEAISGQRRAMGLIALFMAGVLFAKILIIRQFVVLDEIAGVAAAFVFWRLLSRSEGSRASLVVAVLAIYVVAWQLAPVPSDGVQGEFAWVPFLSLINGERGASVQFFFEKLFYYGTLVWLMTAAGARLWISAVSIASLLFFTSSAQLYLSGRSAETTDAVIVLIFAAVMALLKPGSSRPPSASPVAFSPNAPRPPAGP